MEVLVTSSSHTKKISVAESVAAEKLSSVRACARIWPTGNCWRMRTVCRASGVFAALYWMHSASRTASSGCSVVREKSSDDTAHSRSCVAGVGVVYSSQQKDSDAQQRTTQDVAWEAQSVTKPRV